MNTSLILNTLILALTLITPFVVLRAISFAKKGEHQKHIRWQKTIFWTCITAVILLEMQIRAAGGSGSIVQHSSYYNTSTFKWILASHIIVALLTYITWGYLIFASSRNYKKGGRLPGVFSKRHQTVAKIVFIGLVYTAITATYVYLTTFIL